MAYLIRRCLPPSLASSRRRFGSPQLPDWLFIPQEPAINTSTDLRASAQGQSYAASGRISPPSLDCSFDSAGMLGASAAGDRRCRFAYTNLAGAVTPPGWSTVPLSLYAEVRQDICRGAPLGPSSPFTGLGAGAILSAASALTGPPSAALYVDSPLLSLLSLPTPCTLNSDCIGLGGGALVCYDIVSQLVGTGGIGGSLPSYMQDPVAALSAGLRSDGTNPSTTAPGVTAQCTGPNPFKASIRSIIRSLRADFLASDGSTDLRMCLPPIEDLVQAAPGWL